MKTPFSAVPPDRPVRPLTPPVARAPGEALPVIGTYLRLKAVITDPVGLVERSAAAYGEVFTIRIPFAFDLTYLLGQEAYRTVTSLPAEHAMIGPVFGNVPTVGYWFPRRSRDTESLQRLVLTGRRLMATLLASTGTARLAAAIPGIVARHTAAWGDQVDLAEAIHPIVYEAACRHLVGETVWNDMGTEIIPLYRAIADGIDIPRATLAKTPIHLFMPEYRATKILHRVLRRARLRHDGADSPLLRALDDARHGDVELNEPDATWMLMYVLWNATAYPGSYTFWTLLDILQRPDLLNAVRTQPGDTARQALLGRCLWETIRLNPVSSLVRSLAAPLDIEVDGKRYVIPAGGYVGVFPAGLNRDSARIQDPDDYLPQRYLMHGPGRLALFGRGAFGCVAQEFSRTLTACVLDELLRRYDLPLLEPPPARQCRVHLTYPSRSVQARVVPATNANIAR